MNSKKLITMIFLLLTLLAIPVQALAMDAATAEIPFTVKNAPGTVVMEAVDDSPLPNPTVFEGVSSGKFEMTFSKPGAYSYKIYQKPGTDQNVTYDITIYTVCISVFVNEDGNLYSVTAINAAESSQKAEEVVFKNTLIDSDVSGGSTEPSKPSVPSEPSSPGEPSAPSVSGKPGEFGNSAGTNASMKPNSPTAPSTGDESRLSLWILLMAFSILGIIVVSHFLKKGSSQTQKEKTKEELK